MGGIAESRRHPMWWWGLLVLAIALATARVSSVQGLLLDDLEVYRLGGRAVLDHQSLYDATSGRLQFTYPPVAALFFIPLALIPLPLAGWIVAVCSVGAYAVVVRVLVRSQGMRAWNSLPLVLVMGSSEPVTRTIVLGQVNLVLMAAIVVDVLLMGRRARGLLTGWAASIKLTPSVFGVLYLLRRDWSAAGRMLVAAVAFGVLSWAVLPQDSMRYWSGTAGQLGRFGLDDVVGSHNQSLYALGLRAFGVADANGIWVLVAATFGIALGVLAASRCLAADDLLGALSAVALAALLASPISWTHHWVWLLVVVLWLWGRSRPFLAWGVALCAWLAPMWAVSVTVANVAHLSGPEVVVASTDTLMALGLLVVMLARVPVCQPGVRHLP